MAIVSCCIKVLTVLQSAIVYFLVQYAYFSPTPRTDGYEVGLYEYSTVSALVLSSPSKDTHDFLDYGYCGCSGCEPLQWPQHNGLDWLDLVCYIPGHRAYMAVYGKHLRITTL